MNIPRARYCLLQELGTDRLYDFYNDNIDEYELMEELCDEGIVFTDLEF